MPSSCAALILSHSDELLSTIVYLARVFSVTFCRVCYLIIYQDFYTFVRMQVLSALRPLSCCAFVLLVCVLVNRYSVRTTVQHFFTWKVIEFFQHSGLSTSNIIEMGEPI